MATSLFSNLLYNTTNDTTTQDDPEQTKRELLSLLEASAKCVEKGTCDAVIYQTMGALHQYTALSAGIQQPLPKASTLKNETPRPGFVLPNESVVDGSNAESLEQQQQQQQDDALAYGWIEELSIPNGTTADESSSPTDVAWNPVLALLVQQEQDDEPCLWITKEVLANDINTSNTSSREQNDETRDETSSESAASPLTELESLHSIPLRRRLRSCRYQNFYGDHRILLELKHRIGKTTVTTNGRWTPKKGHPTRKLHQIVLRCPSEQCAKAWVDCLQKFKKKKPDASHDNIELEILDDSSAIGLYPSASSDGGGGSSTHSRSSFRRLKHTRIIHVIDSQEEEEDDNYGIPEHSDSASSHSNNNNNTKRLAEQLQEAEDRKRAQKLANKEAAEEERLRKSKQEYRERLEKERLEVERQQKLKQETVEQKKEKQRIQEVEHKKALERKKEEELQQKRLAAIEKNVETIAKATTGSTSTAATAPVTTPAKPAKPRTAAEKQKERMEREIAARKRAEEERRRIEIEYEQKKKERVEQRRRDLEAQRKAAREEQKRKELIQKQKFLTSEKRKEDMKKAAMKAPPKKATKGVFSTNNTTKKDDKSEGGLWHSLDKHRSAFEAADEERKRKEAEKLEKEKAQAEAEEEEEDPEVVRKRIAEKARQRVVQEEMGKIRKQSEALKQKQAQNGWADKQQPGSTSPHVTLTPTNIQLTPTKQTSVTPPTPGQQQQHNPTLKSIPSISPLKSMPQAQSWNKMQQPPYPPQQQQQQQKQAHFQRTQQASTAYHRQPQPNRSPPGSFGNPAAPFQAHARHPQPQTHASQSQTHQQAPIPPQHEVTRPPSQNDGESSESALKKNVLIQWGLQPPTMQVLKPVDQLLCSIHSVFPPSFGVSSHEYFQSWKPITRSDLLSSTAGALDENKLKKMVRKVRFFLHPDKLPHDLTEDQDFLCKLLWDVINDAFEEYKKSKDDLDWM